MTTSKPTAPNIAPRHWTPTEWLAAFTLAGTIVCYMVRLTLDVNAAITVHDLRLKHIEERLDRLEPRPGK